MCRVSFSTKCVSHEKLHFAQWRNGFLSLWSARERGEKHAELHIYAIAKTALTTGRSRDIVKQELEADLMRYVKEREYEHPAYIRETVSENAEYNMQKYQLLNELIADTLLLQDKGIVRDPTLLDLVRRCI